MSKMNAALLFSTFFLKINIFRDIGFMCVKNEQNEQEGRKRNFCANDQTYRLICPYLNDFLNPVIPFVHKRSAKLSN